MKTMNLIIKTSILGLTLICISLISFASENDSNRLMPSSESIIESLTSEIRSKVNLAEARERIRESAVVVVQLVINSEGKAEISNKSANNPDFEEYISDKLYDINTEFPEEYYGKAVVYRFSLI